MVLSLLKKLDVRKSVGPESLSAHFLKEVAEPIAAPLTKLYNKSLESGIVPNQWKCSNVTPVHKGGSCGNPGNFRPISVVPVVAKIFEKIVASQLNSYFEDHQLLSMYQGAYRHGKSTEQLLMVAVDTIVYALDGKSIACVAFLDLRKAFDSLDHTILLQRLSKLGVVVLRLLGLLAIYQTMFNMSNIMVHIQSGARLVGEYPRAVHLDHYF